jgi:predicted MFS family arabinose efflux permease
VTQSSAARTPATLRADTSSLVRHHDFRALWVGDTVSQLGTQLTQLALPVLAVQVLAAGPQQMGLLTAAETLAFLVVGLPAGAWVDRWRTKRVLIAGDLVRAAVFAGVPLAWWAGRLTLGQLYAVALVGGIATVFFDVGYQSYLPEIVDGPQVVEGNAKLQASQSVAQVAGPAVGGLLLRVLSAPVLLGVDAASYLVSAFFVGRIRRPSLPAPRQGRRPLRVEIAEGLGFVVRHPLLPRIVACTSLSNLFQSMSGALFVLYLLRDLHQPTSAIGLLFSVAAVGGLLGALVTERITRWLGEGRTIPFSALLCGPALALTPLAGALANVIPPLALLMAGGLIEWAAVVVYNITQVSFRQRVCPPELLGRMNASVRFIVWGTQPIGALVGGLLGSRIGVLPTLWLATAGVSLASLPVLFSPLSRMRDLPAGPQITDLVDG